MDTIASTATTIPDPEGAIWQNVVPHTVVGVGLVILVVILFGCSPYAICIMQPPKSTAKENERPIPC
jgi:hypothetical protein